MLVVAVGGTVKEDASSLLVLGLVIEGPDCVVEVSSWLRDEAVWVSISDEPMREALVDSGLDVYAFEESMNETLEVVGPP